MIRLNCVACPHLERKTIIVKGRGTTRFFSPLKDLVVYDCDQGRFPYLAALSGLLKPGQGISLAAQGCSQPDWGRCVVCREPGKAGVSHDPVIPVCKKHYRAWLSDCLEKRAHYAPRGRVVSSRWLEVFLEFVASARETNPALQARLAAQAGEGV